MAQIWLAVLFAAMSIPAYASVDDILEAIRQSEFRFARSGSEVPFIPIGWLQYRHYPSTEFHDEKGVLAPAAATEHSTSLGAVVPVYVGRRDMALLGGDIASDSIKVTSGPYRNQRIERITPVAAWLRQIGSEQTLGAFVAPVFSKEYEQNRPWSVNGFAGLLGLYWYSDTAQWVYGGIYQTYFGDKFLYPYLGLQWNPTPKWSVSLLLPWPSIAYSPARRWLLQLGIRPGGSSWVSHDNGYESTQAFSSWDMSLGVGYQLQGSWWLYADAGRTGFRGLTQTISGNVSSLDAKPSSVYTIALQFRP